MKICTGVKYKNICHFINFGFIKILLAALLEKRHEEKEDDDDDEGKEEEEEIKRTHAQKVKPARATKATE